MTEKRYKVHNMIKGMNVGESVDLELMKELIEKYGAYEYVDVGITNNGKEMTYKEVVDLLNENEQLKQQLRDYHNAFDCSQCRYQNYDWFDDGDEFEVCDKGNNEAQMGNHSCKDWEEL